jgi:hypothetical protein
MARGYVGIIVEEASGIGVSSVIENFFKKSIRMPELGISQSAPHPLTQRSRFDTLSHSGLSDTDTYQEA